MFSKLEAGQAQLQSSTEEEEQAKAALTGRIQRLTKLILVSTRNTPGTTHVPQKSVYTRRHSFGEEELAHLPDRTRENAICCDDSGGGSLDPEVQIDGCANPTNLHEIVKDYKKSKRKGMLGWFKSRKPNLPGGLSPVATDDGQCSTSGFPATAFRSSQNRVMVSDVKEKQRKVVNKKQGDIPITNSSPEKGQIDEFLSTGFEISHINLTGTTITDQLDVLQEQVKLLAEEVAQCTYSLKRLSGEAINSPEKYRDEEQIRKLTNKITENKLQIHQLEQCIIVSLEAAPQSVPRSELSQALAKIATRLSEKTFEHEIDSVDKRILREQLQMKISENAEMQEAILLLRQQLSTSSDICSIFPEGQNQSAMLNASALDSNPINLDERNKGGKESPLDATTPTSVISLNRFFGQDDSKDCKNATNSNLQISNIENLKQENARLAEEKVGLEIHSQKLAEEASYAKELAAAAAIELQHLTEEVTRLSYRNAELIGELGSTKENELHTRYQREAMLEAALSEKEQVERELDKQLSEAKRHEEVLQSDLENLWVLIENMRKSGIETDDGLSHRIGTSNYRSAEVPVGISLSAGSQVSRNLDKIGAAGASNLKEIERMACTFNLYLDLGEDLSGLDMATLEELQNVHVEAITKICQAKVGGYWCSGFGKNATSSEKFEVQISNVEWQDLLDSICTS
uniref:Uncharacterized protein n=1 Tax=Chenopodium quinoa TaxID=63459 RepID=A0A803LK18_CHEQI